MTQLKKQISPLSQRMIDEMNMRKLRGYRRPTKKKGYFAKREYQYNTDNDTYTCPQGQALLYKTTNREGYRHYHSDPKQCATCPVRERCTNSQNMTKVVTRHVWQASV